MVKGYRDEYHPNRQVGAARWASAPIDDFGGGDFPSQTSPPQSEQPGRGVAIDPFDAEYQEIGNTGTYRTPDRSMTVGIMTQQEAAARHPPQSEQEGRGVFAHAPLISNTTGEPMVSEQLTDSYGPVAEIINRQQWQVS